MASPTDSRRRRSGAGNSARATLMAASALALAAMIGIASRGHPWKAPARSGPSRLPTDTLGTIAFVLIGVLGLAAIVLVMVTRRIATGGSDRTQRSWWEHMLLVVLVVAALAAIGRNQRQQDPLRLAPVKVTGTAPKAKARTPAAPVQPADEWRSVVIVGLLLALAGGATIRARARQRSRASSGTAGADDTRRVGEAIDDAIEASLADPEPRRAIVSAFAAMESAFGRTGHPRRPAETAVEYVARVLRTVAVDRAPIERLRERYLVARFSSAPLTVGDRNGALDDLREIRAGLPTPTADASVDAAPGTPNPVSIG